ncbi:hypothetical protein FDP22_11655 [Paroceanicella profunda]|uniref:Tetratricopeptide repeat protein n=1 Tax=Paroceanicella profunda TaxID=2579971 RepID=A0A5B8FXM5_9RHOB|nr:hypothetical protein [Paroceanicella profunda]QDL92374.1 hypothetical protein FDP22_11655 [Paroceanicella profunda]
MSDTDSFIDEVSDELRRERLFRLFRKWGPYVIAALVLLVAASAWNEWRKSQETAAAEARGAAIAAALEAKDPEARLTALDAVDGGVAVAFLKAQALAESGKTDAAVAMLDTIIAAGAAGQIYHDAATLKKLSLQRDGLTPEQRIGTLELLVGPDAPFRLVALEMRAVARIEAGDPDGARDDLGAAMADPQASQGLRGRAAALLQAIGGSLDRAG